uniref:MI domain-containing protein n=1 Tax=Triticum urartu TaxID=4572 RepID=A0A8R7V2Y5_TRIUA
MASPRNDGGFLTQEQREKLRIAVQNAETLSLTSPRSPTGTTTSALLQQYELHQQQVRAAAAAARGGGGGAGARHARRSHSGKAVKLKKDGAGGKGTWGRLIDADTATFLDRNDPNYDSDEEPYELIEAPATTPLEDYKKSLVTIIEEYFSTGDVKQTGSDLKELGYDDFHRYFVKKLVSMAMDRHDKEKEMVSVLLSSLYGDGLSSTQIKLGFVMLLQAVDDLAVDIPDAVDVLALFIARAVVDDILPPAFLNKAKGSLTESSKGLQVLQIAAKSYLSAPHHAELLERRWGGSTHITVEEVKRRITDLLKEYIKNGDTAEACRCIRELAVPFFHHEVVKRAVTLGMESPAAETLIVKLLKEASEEGANGSVQDDDHEKLRRYKKEAVSMIHEYFLSDDIPELIRTLKELGLPEYNPVFIKKLITIAMDRKNREKEMASVLLSSLSMELFSSEDIVKGFIMLLESAEDTALDILDASDELGLFLARAVIDDVLAPLNLDEIGSILPPKCSGA